jgi:hypothetical protein
MTRRYIATAVLTSRALRGSLELGIFGGIWDLLEGLRGLGFGTVKQPREVPGQSYCQCILFFCEILLRIEAKIMGYKVMIFVWPEEDFASLHHQSGGPPQISIPWLPRAVPSLHVIIHINIHSLKSRNIPWGRAVRELKVDSEDSQGEAGREGRWEGGDHRPYFSRQYSTHHSQSEESTCTTTVRSRPSITSNPQIFPSRTPWTVPT